MSKFTLPALALMVLTQTTCSGRDDQRRAPVEQLQLSGATLVIGRMEGDERYLLHRPRMARTLPDGRIALINQNREILIYAQDGRFDRKLGGYGAGPAEFQQLSWFGVLSRDSLIAFDNPTAQLRIMGLDGSVGSTIRVPPGLDALVGFAQLDRSTVVCIGRSSPKFDDTATPQMRRDTVPVWLIDREGKRREIATIPGRWWWWGPRTGRRWPALAPENALAVWNDAIVLSDGETFDVLLVNRRGKILRTIHGNRPQPRITSKMLEAWKTDAVRDMLESGMPPQVARVPPGTPMHLERVPGYYRLVVSADGRLWAQKYRLPGEETYEWDVFEWGGSVVATLTIPRRLVLTEAGRSYVQGILTDSLGVQSVVRYNLKASARPTGS